MSHSSISDEEKALFRKEMSTVKPLKPVQQVANVPSRPKIQIRARELSQDIPVPQHYLSNYYNTSIESETILSYTNHAIPSKRFRQLKRGEIKWQARLDLHGLKPDDASNALYQFIHKQSEAGLRILLIIHGKGGQTGQAPILKNLVNHWLKQLPQVLAFHSALPKDGGAGALYVLLKK